MKITVLCISVLFWSNDNIYHVDSWLNVSLYRRLNLNFGLLFVFELIGRDYKPINPLKRRLILYYISIYPNTKRKKKKRCQIIKSLNTLTLTLTITSDRSAQTTINVEVIWQWWYWLSKNNPHIHLINVKKMNCPQTNYHLLKKENIK